MARKKKTPKNPVVKKDTSSKKALAVRMAMEQIEKQYGKGAIMRMGSKGEVKKVNVIPTGSIALDVALGVGGLPRGRVVEIYGPEAPGKTTLVRSGASDVVAIDSVAALTPRAEIEGEMGEAMIGVQARLMSQALRKLTAGISKSKEIVIFTNQLRHKIGVMFGNPSP